PGITGDRSTCFRATAGECNTVGGQGDGLVAAGIGNRCSCSWSAYRNGYVGTEGSCIIICRFQIEDISTGGEACNGGVKGVGGSDRTTRSANLCPQVVDDLVSGCVNAIVGLCGAFYQ